MTGEEYLRRQKERRFKVWNSNQRSLAKKMTEAERRERTAEETKRHKQTSAK